VQGLGRLPHLSEIVAGAMTAPPATLAATAAAEVPGNKRSRRTCCSWETGPLMQIPTTPMRRLRSWSQFTVPLPACSRCWHTVSLPAMLQPTTTLLRATTVGGMDAIFGVGRRQPGRVRLQASSRLALTGFGEEGDRAAVNLVLLLLGPRRMPNVRCSPFGLADDDSAFGLLDDWPAVEPCCV
jgi:hypothetical protein